MSEAVFGLVGVVVGALLQGGWDWMMERRRESWAACKHARLFAPSLHRCMFAIGQVDDQHHGVTWGDVFVELESNLKRWPEHADVFAGTLHWDDWFSVYQAVRGIEQLSWAAGTADRDAVVHLEKSAVDDLQHRIAEAAVVCSMVGVSRTGTRGWRRRLRRVKDRLARSERKMLTEVLGSEEAADEVLREREDDS